MTARDARVRNRRSSMMIDLMQALASDEHHGVTHASTQELCHGRPTSTAATDAEAPKGDRETLPHHHGPFKLLRAVRSLKNFRRNTNESTPDMPAKKIANLPRSDPITSTSPLTNASTRSLSALAAARITGLRRGSEVATPRVPSTIALPPRRPKLTHPARSRIYRYMSFRHGRTLRRSSGSWATLSVRSDPAAHDDHDDDHDDDDVVSVQEMIAWEAYETSERASSLVDLSSQDRRASFLEDVEQAVTTTSDLDAEHDTDDRNELAIGLGIDVQDGNGNKEIAKALENDIWSRIVDKVFTTDDDQTITVTQPISIPSCEPAGYDPGDQFESPDDISLSPAPLCIARPKTSVKKDTSRVRLPAIHIVSQHRAVKPDVITPKIETLRKQAQQKGGSRSGSVSSKSSVYSISTISRPEQLSPFSPSTLYSPDSGFAGSPRPPDGLRWQDSSATSVLANGKSLNVSYDDTPVLYDARDGRLGFRDVASPSNVGMPFAVHPAFRNAKTESIATTDEHTAIVEVEEMCRNADPPGTELPVQGDAATSGKEKSTAKGQSKTLLVSRFSADSTIQDVEPPSKYRRASDAVRRPLQELRPMSSRHFSPVLSRTWNRVSAFPRESGPGKHKAKMQPSISSTDLNDKLQALRMKHNMPPLSPRLFDEELYIHPHHPFLWHAVRLYCRLEHEGQCEICSATCCRFQQINAMLQRDVTQLYPGGGKQLREAARELAWRGGDGIEAFKTFITCTECGKRVCPSCASRCVESLCRDLVCKHCVAEPWKTCPIREG